jgi:TonB family protein
MSANTHRTTLLNIHLMEERYGRSVLVSIAIHGFVALLVLFGGYLLPSVTIELGGGIGGGPGEDIATVGVIEELSGGTGMVKPGLIPKPPARLDKPRQDTSKAIPLPDTVEPKRKRVSAKEAAKTAEALAKSNVIPTTPEPGSGGVAGRSGGGSGIGISIGSGANGFGDHWYARGVEARISKNWIRPAPGVHVEMTYSFYINANGRIYGIKQEKSSGNPQMDLTALRAINASNPLTPPPPEFRGRAIKFVANFVYPLNP